MKAILGDMIACSKCIREISTWQGSELFKRKIDTGIRTNSHNLSMNMLRMETRRFLTREERFWTSSNSGAGNQKTSPSFQPELHRVPSQITWYGSQLQDRTVWLTQAAPSCPISWLPALLGPLLLVARPIWLLWEVDIYIILWQFITFLHL